MPCEALCIFQTSQVCYLPVGTQSRPLAGPLLVYNSTCATCSAAGMSVHGCVRVGLTRTLPKAPMATSGGSSMGRAYVPPTYTNSGGKSGHLRSTHIAKDSLAYPSNSLAIATATSFCILSSLCAYHTRVWDHCVHKCGPQPKREVVSIITDSSLLLQYVPHTTQAYVTSAPRGCMLGDCTDFLV